MNGGLMMWPQLCHSNDDAYVHVSFVPEILSVMNPTLPALDIEFECADAVSAVVLACV